MNDRKKTESAAAVIEMLFPQNKLLQETLRTKLTTYAHPKKGVFPDELISRELYGRDNDKYRYFFPKKSHRFVENILQLDAFIGTPKDVISIVNQAGDLEKLHQKVISRIGELEYRGELYRRFAKDGALIIENLFNNPDFVNASLFEVTEFHGNLKSKDDSPNLNELGQHQKIRTANFLGLEPLSKIEQMEQHGGLSDTELMANKAVLYLEMNNQELALKYANETLQVDPENGFAWMVKGFLALDGVKQAYKDTVTASELGANEHALTSEERWLQEMRNEAETDAYDMLLQMIHFSLNAWKYWPVKSTYFPVSSSEYKQKLIQQFFEYAPSFTDTRKVTFKPSPDFPFDQKLLAELIERDYDELYWLQTPWKNTKFFLTKILPHISEANPRMGCRIASKWADEVRKSRARKDERNPPSPFTDVTLMAVGQNLMHLNNLALVMPFSEVETLMHDVDTRFNELNRLSRLMNWSEFYLAQVKASDAIEAISVCKAALKNIPFNEADFDQRLFKQWNYLQLRFITQHAVESIIKNDATIIASFLEEHITTELLEITAGFEYFHRDVEGDYETYEEWEYYDDLAGKRCHVLHDDMELFLSIMFSSSLESEWLEDTLSGVQESFGLAYRHQILNRFVIDSFDGKVHVSYREYLQALEQQDDEDEIYRDCDNGRLEGQSALSFILTFVLNNSTKGTSTLEQITVLKSMCDQLQLDNQPNG